MEQTGVDEVPLSLRALPMSPSLRNFFMRRAPEADVDDLVQEVLLRIHQRREPPAIENLKGYVHQVAASVLVDSQRRSIVRKRSAHCELTEIAHPVDEVSPERVLQGRQNVGRVMAALELLPERTRHILMLVRFENLSYAAAAKHFGVSVSAVEKHIMRAMRHLKDSLQDVDGQAGGRS